MNYRLPILNTCDIIISYCVILQLFMALIAEPTDHLLPPTNPPKALPYRTTNADQTYSYNTNIKNKIPLRIPVQDAHVYLQHQHHHHPPQQQQQQRQPSTQSSERVNFMTRIARWLGFSETPYEQKTSHGNYDYPQPNATISNTYDKKASCNLCNKYPWVPLLSTKVPWQEQSSQQYLPYKQAVSYTPKPPKKFQQQQFPLKQRALQFNFSVVRPPAPIQGAIKNIDSFAPIPVSNLRSVVLPPLHNHHNQYVQQTVNNIAPLAPLTVQELPSAESSSHFSEAVGAHSELQSNRVRSANHPKQEIITHYQNTNNNNNNDIEFIKSHQLTDFVTSVEYPATFVESHTIDLLKPDKNTNTESSNVKTIHTVKYNLNDLNTEIHKYVPASHLLTEHGTYISDTSNNNDDQTTSVPISKQTATISTVYHHIPSQQQQQQQQQQLQTQTLSLPFNRYYEADNFPSASSQQQLQEIDAQKIHFEAWQALQNEYYDRKNKQNIQNTQIPVPIPIPIPTMPLSTKSLPYESMKHHSHSHSHSHSNDHLSYVHHLGNEDTPHSVHKEIKNHMEPEIQKQSFDLPNNYDFGNKNKNAPPRPFTLNIALPNNYVHNINHINENQVKTLPVISTPQILQVTSTTPVSNSMQDTTMKTKMKQVVIPYKRRHKPRPFQSTQPLIYNGHSGSTINYHNKLMSPQSTTNDIEQQESKVVSLAAEHPSPQHTSRERQSSKFLTKILASNLRELLKHEREMKQTKSSSFDLIKLRRNIDGWTEQEYTSLSHRPSTPMIRGRSKHIPSEYLSTTTSKTRVADFDRYLSPNVSELSTSINNLEHLLISEENRASKRYLSHINDNSLLDYFDDSIHHQSIHSTTTSTTTTTPLTPTPTKQPLTIKSPDLEKMVKSGLDDSHTIFRVSPSELWKKAKVAITADTKENVYVVTPQPRLLSKGSPLTSKAIEEDDSDSEKYSRSKTSRFLLPKIQRNASNDTRYEIDQGKPTTDTTLSTTTMLYSPDYFGLVGLSSYVPADPVEIIDGNSKVITIVTPASTQNKGDRNR